MFRRSTLALISAALLVALGAVHADAASGDTRLQRLAQAQTELLLRTFNDKNLTGPANCSQGQDPKGFEGVYLLPTLLLTGAVPLASRTFSCHIKARSVLVDLGGLVVTEDTSGFFDRGTLEAFCEANLPDFFPTAHSLTVDGLMPDLAQNVSTTEFIASVKPPSGPFYFGESRKLGHPGELAATYCGFKAEVPLDTGTHVITVDLGGAVFTYNITVK